jgi:delta 1-pyrroline-5-carboxylate dehydrogenase
MNRAKNRVQKRPAETTTLVAGAVVAVLALLGVEADPTVVVAILVGISALPSFISALVDGYER